MKHTVLTDKVSAARLRPPDMLARLRELSAKDANRYLVDPGVLKDVPCPACESQDSAQAFLKGQFSFRQCAECQSVYVSPRPDETAIARYYRESDAARQRAEYFAGGSASERLQDVVASRVDWIAQLIQRSGTGGQHFADYGTLYPSLFAEVQRFGTFKTLYSVEPPALVIPKLNNDEVVIDWPGTGTVKALTAFEQLEHQVAPRAFIGALRDLLAPSGILFVTTRTISGFDLLTLWEKAPYIFVPEHLNLLSIEGLSQLFQSSGFELLELSTPGLLDVEMIVQASRSDRSIQLPKFVEYLVNQRSDEALADLQGFLQRHRLSSHVRIAARKPAS